MNIFRYWVKSACEVCLGCSDSSDKTSAKPETIDVEPGAFGKIADFTFTRTTGDRVEFELEAKSAIYFDQDSKADFEKAQSIFAQTSNPSPPKFSTQTPQEFTAQISQTTTTKNYAVPFIQSTAT